MLDWVNVLLFMATLFSAICAALLWHSSRRQTYNSVFHDLINEYKSPEFLSAIIRLYDFYDKCNNRDIMADQYNKIRKNEIWTKKPLNKTLHFQRRLVSNFYCYLAIVIRNRFVPRSLIYSYWNINNLSIIKKVLLPIGQDSNKGLDVLYRDCIRYTNNRINKYDFGIIIFLITVLFLILIFFVCIIFK